MKRRDWVQALAKAEYHLHLEGAIPWQMVLESEGEPLPESPYWHRPNFRYSDFNEFQMELSKAAKRVIRGLEDFQRLARYQFQKLYAENVTYLEISVSLAGLLKRNISVKEWIEATRLVVPEGMTVTLFIGFGRKDSFTDEMIADTLTAPHLAGIDVFGDERLGKTETFVGIYEEARRLGLRTKAHAGELLEADAIYQTLDSLQPQRIQHGITGVKDKALLKLLADEGIILDICPSSNVMLNVISDMANYPIRALLDAGIEITLNTDDPALFNCSMSSELLAMLEHDLLTPQEIASIQHRAFDRALMDDAQRQAAQAQIAELLKVLDKEELTA
jgi:adenosine deaminase